MRIPLVAALFVSLVGCVGVVDAPGVGTPGDDAPPAGTPDAPTAPTPRLESTIDKATVTTELGTTHEFKIALTASGDFAGAVTITPTIVDGTGWNLVVDSTTVTLPANGTGLVTGTLQIPTDAASITGTVKFNVSSSLGAVDLTSAITATKQVTLVVTQDGAGQCVYPGTTTKVLSGTKLRILNMGTDNVIIHGNNGIPHQDTGGTGIATNASYDVTMTSGGSWYCHSPGPSINQNVQVN